MKSKIEIINKKKIIIIFIKLYIIALLKYIKNNCIKIKINKINNLNLNKIKYFKDLSFNISLINYSFSLKFKLAKLEYYIGFYKSHHNLIAPPYLTRYHNLHIFCVSHDFNKNISIFSIAGVNINKYYKCIEYIHFNDSIKLGFFIFKNKNYIEYFNLFLFTNRVINYNNLIFINESEYEPFLLLNQYKKFKHRIKVNDREQNKKENLQLRQSYYRNPTFLIKYFSALNESKWYFKNIFNNYFCFCKSNITSNCLYKNLKQNCKYFFYLNVVDNNRNIFKKTNYLFADFYSTDTATGESFLIFNEMNKQKMNVHYMTKREDIYKNFSNYNLKSKNQIIYDSFIINGNFLEKYLEIILKLKSTISGAKIFSIDNLFYNIEYITYICLGHGISYLKDFLYKDYYSCDIYDKILIPDSKLLISNAKKFGWKEKNIIKIGLPRWDTFAYNSRELRPFQNKSIFTMFTWRELKKDKNISKYYFKNIFRLINDNSLNNILKESNIILYFCLHHMIEKYKFLFNINKNIKYINQNEILECLNNSDLIITDFSSVIFDFIIRKKPYIIYIPDSEDINIQNIYSDSYYDKIKLLKNGSIFKNRFFKTKDTINKIIYYINNNFELESEMKNFYKYLNLNKGKNIDNFIKYLKFKLD